MQDTVTGFLLAGVGNVDMRRKSNFLIVNESKSSCCEARYAVLRYGAAWLNFRCHGAETTVKMIEDAFKDLTNREGIAIVMISQYVSGFPGQMLQSRGCATAQLVSQCGFKI